MISGQPRKAHPNSEQGGCHSEWQYPGRCLLERGIRGKVVMGSRLPSCICGVTVAASGGVQEQGGTCIAHLDIS